MFFFWSFNCLFNQKHSKSIKNWSEMVEIDQKGVDFNRILTFSINQNLIWSFNFESDVFRCVKLLESKLESSTIWFGRPNRLILLLIEPSTGGRDMLVGWWSKAFFNQNWLQMTPDLDRETKRENCILPKFLLGKTTAIFNFKINFKTLHTHPSQMSCFNYKSNTFLCQIMFNNTCLLSLFDINKYFFVFSIVSQHLPWLEKKISGVFGFFQPRQAMKK